ncbi:MAG TPA: D-glycero-beta-D-manno-heptose 1-phosphate adenylyltransferase [Candidatus Mcinerneyibacterium sp.]|nr:D-glycero-beta-D-manno-heptose 1-phosphate adenylyltransferase [Candidatus Mcinerneyibacterium sp.]
MKNLISRKSAGKFFEKINGKKVFTNGCFDILHVGHVRYLKKAREMGDCLIIGLNSDSSVRRIKGDKRPIVPEDERAEMLLSLEYVDYVVFFEEETPYLLIKDIKPDILVKGGDWDVKDIVGSDLVKKAGGTVKNISYIDGKSTTNIINKILENYKKGGK